MYNATKKIIKQYHDNQTIYRSLKEDIEDILIRIIETNHFRISNMAIRIKSEEALMKKITYKNRYKDINEITDVVACRIITLFENDVDRIYECVKDNFEIVEYNDKRKKQASLHTARSVIKQLRLLPHLLPTGEHLLSRKSADNSAMYSA